MEEKVLWWIHGKAYPVLIVDTGGLGGNLFSTEIEKQVKTALEKADLILYVLDSQRGPTFMDHDLLQQLRCSGILNRIPMIGALNKVDIEQHENRISEFYELGLEQIFTISAEHGRGIDDLKLMIAETLDFKNTYKDFKSEIIQSPKISKIAIVGRPNVGKSTLINGILDEDRMITSPMAGTTVDSIDSLIQLQGKPYILIDTAGIRRKSKTEKGIEVLSVVQTRKALERAELAVLVLDGEGGITDQDEKIAGLIEEIGCSVVLMVNKWDTQRRNEKFTREIAAELIRKQMAFLKYAPILFSSALYREGIENLGKLFEEILFQRNFKIPTREFTEWVREESHIHNPMNAKFYLCHQSGRHPPTFVCHVNDPEKVHFSLSRHLVNALRKKWGYMGSPVRLLFVQATGKGKTQSTR